MSAAGHPCTLAQEHICKSAQFCHGISLAERIAHYEGVKHFIVKRRNEAGRYEDTGDVSHRVWLSLCGIHKVYMPGCAVCATGVWGDARPEDGECKTCAQDRP